MAMPPALARYHAQQRAGSASAKPARRGPSPMIAKLKDKLASANKRARNAVAGGGTGVMRDVSAFVGGAALGYGESKGMIPARLGPAGMAVDSALAIAAIGAFVIPRFVKGGMGKIVHDATMGVAGVAGHRMASGNPVIGDDDGLSGWSDRD